MKEFLVLDDRGTCIYTTRDDPTMLCLVRPMCICRRRASEAYVTTRLPAAQPLASIQSMMSEYFDDSILSLSNVAKLA